MHLSVYASKIAFTLAEVLITLGIIGVVAALTLPTLIQKNETKVKITAIKKAQSILSQSALMLTNDNGGSLAGLCDSDEDHNCFAEKLLLYMKNIKYCEVNSEDEFCKSIYVNSRPHIILNDGTIIQVYHSFSDCRGADVAGDKSTYLPTAKLCASILVDYNGLKGPNVRGDDIFGFSILNKGQIVAWGSPSIFKETHNPTAETCENKKESADIRQYCTYCYLYGDCRK